MEAKSVERCFDSLTLRKADRSLGKGCERGELWL